MTEAALVLGLLMLVALVVLAPLRSGAPGDAAPEAGARDELEAAKEAKYREIRDAELDFRMGKVSERDWRATDAELRGQAAAILRGLDELGG